MSEPLLEVSGLSKHYPMRHDLRGNVTSWLSAVDDVSFSVPAGSTVAIVGESGSGKSTLARLLVRLERPTSGTIRFKERELESLSSQARRELSRKIQIVFQDPQSSLNPRMHLEGVLRDGFYGLGLSRQQERQRAAELLDIVGLSASMLRNYPHQLSGGQRQRVAIARALASDPEILVADEPVSALDGSVQGQVLNLLRRLQREQNLTLVFITHDLSVAHFMSDRIIVMHLGKIVETASRNDLFARPAHPYTQALLSAIPRFGHGGTGRIVLEGDALSPIDPPAACRFAPRCFRKIAICTREEPQLATGPSETHQVACFNWELSNVESFESAAAAPARRPQ